jgi:hypothetical protein
MIVFSLDALLNNVMEILLLNLNNRPDLLRGSLSKDAPGIGNFKDKAGQNKTCHRPQ